MQAKLYEYEGELLTVKTIAGRVSLSPSTLYKYLNQGFTLYDSIEIGRRMSDKVFKNREKTNNQTAKKYPYLDSFYTVEEVAKKEKIDSSSLYRWLKKDLSMEEAVATIKSNISLKYPFMGGYASLYRISMITGVSKYYLEKRIDSKKKYNEQEIWNILDSYHSPNILMAGEDTLLFYCIKHQYNYNALYYLIKRKKYSVEEAIEYYLQNGQGTHFNYSFELGNILLYHFCIKEQLNDRYIKCLIGQGVSTIQAIQASIFLSKQSYGTRQKRSILYQIYCQEGINMLSDDSLSMEDKEYILRCDKKFQHVFLEYRLYQVLALLPRLKSQKERKIVLQEFSLTEEDLINSREELFHDFEMALPNTKDGDIQYIWRIQEEKPKGK